MRSRSTGWTRRAVAFQLIALTGCSLFVSLDGLSGGSASSPDGSTDANASDVVASDVVAIDAGDAGDAGFVCTGFCDSFDDRTDPLGAWDSVNQFGDGDPVNISISTDQFLSAPNSLHLHVPAKSSGPAGAVFLVKTFPLNAAKISVDFDIKLVGLSSGFGGYSNFMEVQLGGSYAGSISANGSGDTTADYWVLFPDGGHIQPSFDIAPNDSSWHHVHYAALYDPTNGSFFVTWDGNTIANITSTLTFASAPAPSTIEITLGYTAQPDVPTFDIYYDNVQVQ